jgi:hypothetical protein
MSVDWAKEHTNLNKSKLVCGETRVRSLSRLARQLANHTLQIS